MTALFLTTKNRKLTEFKCSIIFTPASLDTIGLKQFFKIIEPLFENLKAEKNKNVLARTYNLNLDKGATERFHLDTTGRTYDVLFTYEKKSR